MRRDVNDRGDRRLLQWRNRRACELIAPDHIDREDRLEVASVQIVQVRRAREARDSSIVHQNINMTKTLEGSIDHCMAIRGLGHITLDDEGIRASLDTG